MSLNLAVPLPLHFLRPEGGNVGDGSLFPSEETES